MVQIVKPTPYLNPFYSNWGAVLEPKFRKEKTIDQAIPAGELTLINFANPSYNPAVFRPFEHFLPSTNNNLGFDRYYLAGDPQAGFSEPSFKWFLTSAVYLQLTGNTNDIVVEFKEVYDDPNQNPDNTGFTYTSYRGQQYNSFTGTSACLTCNLLYTGFLNTRKKLGLFVYTSNASTVKAFNLEGVSLTHFSGHALPESFLEPVN